jgi:hypothetical protein
MIINKFPLLLSVVERPPFLITVFYSEVPRLDLVIFQVSISLSDPHAAAQPARTAQAWRGRKRLCHLNCRRVLDLNFFDTNSNSIVIIINHKKFM